MNRCSMVIVRFITCTIARNERHHPRNVQARSGRLVREIFVFFVRLRQRCGVQQRGVVRPLLLRPDAGDVVVVALLRPEDGLDRIASPREFVIDLAVGPGVFCEIHHASAGLVVLIEVARFEWPDRLKADVPQRLEVLRNEVDVIGDGGVGDFEAPRAQVLQTSEPDWMNRLFPRPGWALS